MRPKERDSSSHAVTSDLQKYFKATYLASKEQVWQTDIHSNQAFAPTEPLY